MSLTKVGLLLLCLAGVLTVEAAASNLLIVIIYVVSAVLFLIDGYVPTIARRTP